MSVFPLLILFIVKRPHTCVCWGNISGSVEENRNIDESDPAVRIAPVKEPYRNRHNRLSTVNNMLVDRKQNRASLEGLTPIRKK